MLNSSFGVDSDKTNIRKIKTNITYFFFVDYHILCFTVYIYGTVYSS